MSDDKKPVDLMAIRARIASTQGSGNAVNAILYHDAPDMADEIERLRDGLSTAVESAKSQAPAVPDDTPDEYRRGQKRGAIDAAEMVRRIAAKLLPPS